MTASGSGSPRSSVRTTSARIDHDVIFTVGAFLLLPFVFSHIELIRLPSIRMCAAFLIVCEPYSARRGRKMQIRCHSVCEDHSSCAFFQDRCVATERTVNFAPLARD